MALRDSLLHVWNRIKGEPTPQEREDYLRSLRLAAHIKEEAGEIERRLDRILGSQVDVRTRRMDDERRGEDAR